MNTLSFPFIPVLICTVLFCSISDSIFHIFFVIDMIYYLVLLLICMILMYSNMYIFYTLQLLDKNSNSSIVVVIETVRTNIILLNKEFNTKFHPSILPINYTRPVTSHFKLSY